MGLHTSRFLQGRADCNTPGWRPRRRKKFISVPSRVPCTPISWGMEMLRDRFLNDPVFAKFVFPPKLFPKKICPSPSVAAHLLKIILQLGFKGRYLLFRRLQALLASAAFIVHDFKVVLVCRDALVHNLELD